MKNSTITKYSSFLYIQRKGGLSFPHQPLHNSLIFLFFKKGTVLPAVVAPDRGRDTGEQDALLSQLFTGRAWAPQGPYLAGGCSSCLDQKLSRLKPGCFRRSKPQTLSRSVPIIFLGEEM